MIPLKSYQIPEIGSQGRFAAIRKHDIHTGLDLYCKDGDEVRSIEDGIVINVCNFTGPKVGLPWWNDTDAILVKSESGVILYGELKTSLKIGDIIKRGDIIGNIVRVLKKDKGRPMDMLHLELYEESYNGGGVIWNLGDEKPIQLKNSEILIQKFS